MPGSRVRQLIPFVHVADVERSAEFYALLGLEETDRYEKDGWLLWVSMASDRARIMFTLAGEPVHAHDQAVLFYLYASDLDALHRELSAQGHEPGPIEDGTPGPPREFRLEDPDGYVLMVAEDEGH